MAKRGRKTKEEEQRARPRGAAPAGRWECPASLTGAARDAWSLAVELLRERGNLEKTDPTIVEMYAVNVAMLRSAREAIDSKGVLVETTVLNGEGVSVSTSIKANPACAIANAATMRIKAICYDLGLVPATANLTEASDPADVGGKWGDLLGVVG